MHVCQEMSSSLYDTPASFNRQGEASLGRKIKSSENVPADPGRVCTRTRVRWARSTQAQMLKAIV